MMSQGIFLRYLQDRINQDYQGNQGAAADAWGISRGYMNDVLNGHRGPGKKLLEAVGFVRVVSYAAKQPLSKEVPHA